MLISLDRTNNYRRLSAAALKLPARQETNAFFFFFRPQSPMAIESLNLNLILLKYHKDPYLCAVGYLDLEKAYQGIRVDRDQGITMDYRIHPWTYDGRDSVSVLTTTSLIFSWKTSILRAA